MSRACFIDHGQEPNYDLLRRHNITECVMPSQNSHGGRPLSATLCEKVFQQLTAEGKNFVVSVHVAWNWNDGYETGAEFAEYCDAELKRINWQRNPKMVADIEKGGQTPPDELHWVDYLVSFCERWRQLRPTRPTDITFEGMQGGLFNGRGPAVAKILGANVGLIPQAYTGDERRMAEDVVSDDLLPYFPAHRTRLYYLAPPALNWNGYLWRMGLLT